MMTGQTTELDMFINPKGDQDYETGADESDVGWF